MTPKIHIISAHAQGHIDGTLTAALLNHLPNRVHSIAAADVVLVPVSYHGEFQFNQELMAINKPVVIIDLLEYFGQSEPGKTYLFGQTNLPITLEGLRQWHSFDNWVRSYPPNLYFKRELSSQHQTDKVLPIEWPCTLPAWEIESKAAFDVRPFQVFYNWGYSHAIRPRLAGEIYGLMAKGKIEVISSFDHINAKVNEPQPKWISIHSPHTHRTHISEIMVRQAQSKMSVCLPGSGNICFRHGESGVHTVPVFIQDGMAQSYPWIADYNCLRLNQFSDMAEQLLEFAETPRLHDLYVTAQENMDKLRSVRYVNEYFLPSIEKVL